MAYCASDMEPTHSIVDLNNVARCLMADSDLWATGRFERLHLINLLFIQRHLSLLETKIDQYVNYEVSLKGDQPRDEPPETPEQLFAELHDTLRKYGEAVSLLSTLKQTNAPAPHIITALRRTVPEFSSFYQGLDPAQSARLVAPRHFSVGAEPQSWLYQYVARHEHLARIFQRGHTLQGVGYTKFSGNLLVKAEFGLVAICLCLVQLLPVLALTLVSSKAARLAIIICLIVLVSILNALFANTVRATNFGAIAAYSAIVVVFVSQNNQP